MKLSFERHFTKPDEDVYDSVAWRKTDTSLKEPDGTVVFEQKGVEIPSFWSDRAAQIVASKYFRVVNGERETSVKQMVSRVVETICQAAADQGLFEHGSKKLSAFHDELVYMLLHQMFSFNSPVWFNVGVKENPQGSACFILGVDDNMESIINLQKDEVQIFKGGSGAGSNLSNIRSSRERLSGGGWASGPVSFAKGYDAWAGVTKSGGTTRRAAKMNILNVDHPDILEQRDGTPGFVKAKAAAEKLARDLYSTGQYTAEFNVPGNVYDLVGFQNANLSVRVTDTFMTHVIANKDWWIKPVKMDLNAPIQTYKAKEIWDEIVKAAWACGDPGLQFDDTINKWHTCPKSGRINASNPCSEFMFIDNSACNLGSLNLRAFWSLGADFDVRGFEHACRTAIFAMETLVDMSSYPTQEITENSHRFRPLGLGYTNLGTLLMSKGLPYDSDEARNYTASITAMMTGYAYKASAELAAVKGPFEGFAENREDMLRVVDMHHDQAQAKFGPPTSGLMLYAARAFERALRMGKRYGYRNAQATLLAPTGTIAFMMDCDTTSGEPAVALVTYKKLVGGGTLKMPLLCVSDALQSLGYDADVVKQIVDHITNTDGQLPELLKPEHAKVFETALGNRMVSIEGHLQMMAAQQPFLSGAISKTINLPETATLEDISKAYMQAWQLGLKAVALYRNNCKLSQPANTKASKKEEAKAYFKQVAETFPADAPSALAATGPRWGERKRLPDTRKSITHKFTVGGQEGYLFVGLTAAGQPAEIFVEISKEGSTLSGLLNMACISMSIALQHGAPLKTLVEKFKDTKFEPHGFTSNADIRRVSSLADYIARWLAQTFLGEGLPNESPAEAATEAPVKAVEMSNYSGPPCSNCGNLTVRQSSCWLCTTCGTTTGCS